MNVTLTQADPDPASAMWLGIVFAIYAAIGIPANLLVLILTVTKKSLRSVPLNMCIFSLSCTDLLMLVSLLSSTVWAFTFDELVCKIGGVSVYIAAITSMTMPSCLAVCRYAVICRQQNLNSVLRVLRRRRGILALIGMYWTYGLLFPLPLVINDNFGLDPLGCCGITVIDSLNIWIYYYIFVLGPIFAGYIVTFIFYSKLAAWVKETSSKLSISSETLETLTATRSLMRMIKWLLFFPIIVYYPSPTVELLLRIFPNIISIRTARIVMITCPMSHAVDPFFIIVFVKRYRVALIELLGGHENASVPIHQTTRSIQSPAPPIQITPPM